jgi:hypothetical protein
MSNFPKSVVEETVFAWRDNLGYAIKHGPEIALGELLQKTQQLK